MRLDAILQKTQRKGEKGEVKRLPPPIAVADRPYDLPEQDNKKIPDILTSNQSESVYRENIREIVELSQEIQKEQARLATFEEEIDNKQVTNEGRSDFTQVAITDNKQATNGEQAHGIAMSLTVENESVCLDMPEDETDNKRVTNGERSDFTQAAKTDNKRVTNGEWAHGVIMPSAMEKEDLVCLDIPKDETDNKRVTNGERRGFTQAVKTDSKQATGVEKKGCDSIIFLVGLQRAILLFLYQDCKRTRAKITAPMTLEYIGEYVKASKGVVKTTLRRLEEKGYIKRGEFKNGRGGWTRFELPELVYREILQLEMDQQGSSPQWLPVHKLENTGVRNEYKGNKDPQKIEVNLEEEAEEIPQEWRNIDISPLDSIKFTKNHLYQIYKISKLSAEMVQDSIYAFAFDMKENKKSESLKLSPLNFFMGILRKNTPYLPPQNYESPSDKAMRLYVKAKKDQAALRMVQEEQAIEVAFSEWEATLTEEDIQVICPHPCANDRSSIMRKGFLHTHFKNHVWPQLKLTLVDRS